jgi:hypothetical protein
MINDGVEMIKVFHYTSPGVRTHVANVYTSSLEEAFRLTQNINGSWSRSQFFEDGEENSDFDNRVELLVPLIQDDNGKIFGLRSTMMFDEMELNDKIYVVRAAGFALKSITPFENINQIGVA